MISAFTEQAERLLKSEPMTRRDLELALGIPQQRVSEVLREIGANIVDYRRAPRQGRRAPVYALGEQECSHALHIGRVNSVFALGAVA